MGWDEIGFFGNICRKSGLGRGRYWKIVVEWDMPIRSHNRTSGILNVRHSRTEHRHPIPYPLVDQSVSSHGLKLTQSITRRQRRTHRGRWPLPYLVNKPDRVPVLLLLLLPLQSPKIGPQRLEPWWKALASR